VPLVEPAGADVLLEHPEPVDVRGDLREDGVGESRPAVAGDDAEVQERRPVVGEVPDSHPVDHHDEGRDAGRRDALGPAVADGGPGVRRGEHVRERVGVRGLLDRGQQALVTLGGRSQIHPSILARPGS
jgi:hypothetical protein